MPIQYRIIITAKDESAFFANPEQACADIKRILVDRAMALIQPEALAFRADMKRFTHTNKTDLDLPSLLEGLPLSLPTVNGAEVLLTLVIQRDEWAKLLRR